MGASLCRTKADGCAESGRDIVDNIRARPTLPYEEYVALSQRTEGTGRALWWTGYHFQCRTLSWTVPSLYNFFCPTGPSQDPPESSRLLPSFFPDDPNHTYLPSPWESSPGFSGRHFESHTDPNGPICRLFEVVGPKPVV